MMKKVVRKTKPTSFYEKSLRFAEVVDALRIFPRVLVGAYFYILYEVITWYMDLKPRLPEDVAKYISNVEDVVQLIQDQPTTQHTALVSAVVGFGAAVFGLYTNSGRKWPTVVDQSTVSYRNTHETPVDDIAYIERTPPTNSTKE